MPTKEWYHQHKDDPEYKAKRKEEGRRYWEKNKERRNAKRRKRRLEDEEFRLRQNELVRESSKRMMADPEKRAERNRKQCEWYKNSEEAQAKRREYMKSYIEPASTKAKRRAWVTKRRADHMERLVYLLGGKCKICGLVDDPISYDFHHIDPKLKKFEISTWIASTSWDKIWAEAQKCALLCSICHRKVTHAIKQPDWVDQVETKTEGSG